MLLAQQMPPAVVFVDDSDGASFELVAFWTIFFLAINTQENELVFTLLYFISRFYLHFCLNCVSMNMYNNIFPL